MEPSVSGGMEFLNDYALLTKMAAMSIYILVKSSNLPPFGLSLHRRYLKFSIKIRVADKLIRFFTE